MLVDQIARRIRNSGTTSQSHAVSIVIDHISCGTDNANADDSFGKIGESIRGETIAEDEGIEPIQTTKLIECDFTGTYKINRKLYLVELFSEKECILNAICLSSTRRSTKDFIDGTFDQANHAIFDVARHKIRDDLPYPWTKSTPFGCKHFDTGSTRDYIADIE